jgi:hypothetical protein
MSQGLFEPLGSVLVRLSYFLVNYSHGMERNSSRRFSRRTASPKQASPPIRESQRRALKPPEFSIDAQLPEPPPIPRPKLPPSPLRRSPSPIRRPSAPRKATNKLPDPEPPKPIAPIPKPKPPLPSQTSDKQIAIGRLTKEETRKFVSSLFAPVKPDRPSSISPSSSLDDFVSQERLALEDDGLPDRDHDVQTFLAKSRQLSAKADIGSPIRGPKITKALKAVTVPDSDPAIDGPPSGDGYSKPKTHGTNANRKTQKNHRRCDAPSPPKLERKPKPKPTETNEPTRPVKTRAKPEVEDENRRLIPKPTDSPPASPQLNNSRQKRFFDEIMGDLRSGSPPRAPISSPMVSLSRFSRVPSGSRPNWQHDDELLVTRQIPEPFRAREEQENAEFGYAGTRKKKHRKRQLQDEADESPQVKRKKGIPIRTHRAPAEVLQAHPMRLLTQRRQIAPARPMLEIEFVQGLEFGVDNEEDSSLLLLKSTANIDNLVSPSETDEREVRGVQEPPDDEEEEEDEADEDSTIMRFFDGKTIRMIHLSDDDDKVIVGHSDIDISGLEMNLSDWYGEADDEAEESEGEKYFDV